MNKITVYQFTDPVCIWCWGNEPVMRAIDYLYGDKVDTEYIMGGLVEDISTLFEDRDSGEDAIASANERMHRNWIAASARHGMPVTADRITLFSREQPSSFPQNIAYEAAKRQNPVAAKRFLRRIREATFAEARPTARIDVLIELAGEAGLDVADFIDEYTRGNAQADFIQDRTKCRRNGITARKAGRSQANVADFIKRYSTVYPVEIETAFGLDRDQTDAIIDELIASKSVAAEPIGDGRRLTIAKTARKDRSQNAPAAKRRSAKGNAESGNDKSTDKTPNPVTTEA